MPSIPKPIRLTLKTDLEAALKARLAEAQTLFENAHYTTAISLWLYALEMALKVAICHRLDLSELPKMLQTHDFDILLTYTGLSRRYKNSSLCSPQIRANLEHIWTKYGKSQVNDFRYQKLTIRWRMPSRSLAD